MLRSKSTKIARNRVKPATKSVAKKPGFWSHVDWSRVRLWMVGGFFALVWALLWTRAYQVQIIRGPKYAEEARRQHVATELLTGRRGSIMDRHGNVLARSVQSRSIYVRPQEIKNKPETVAFLAKTLEISPKQVRAQLDSTRPFVWVARKVNQRLAESVKEGNMPGVYLTMEYERIYPYKHLAGQLLGFVNVDDKGIEGMEMAFEDKLSGQKVRQVLQRDASGRRFYTKANDDAEDLMGEDLHLTLDTQVQFFAEEALAAGAEQYGGRWSGCLVVDVPTGDILAWAEYPFFNPNLAPQEYSAFVRRNKLAMEALEQGSTIKAFLMAAALQEKVVQPDTLINCEKGRWNFKGATIRDDTHAFDILTASKVLRVSSNIGSAKIGLKLGAAKYHAYLSQLGFGSKNGMPLAGESKGILRPPKQWAELDLATASFGQSFSATALQMAQAYLVLANDGVKKPLRLVSDDTPPAKDEERLFSVETMRQVRSMLRDVVEAEGGTGARARIPGLSVGGKTGTAQKASGGAYGTGRMGSFVGMLPAENPRYLVVVLVDEPVKSQYGGAVAAPVFRQVATRTMAYHGLLPEETPVATVAAKGKAPDKKSEDKGSKKGAKGKADAKPAPPSAVMARGGEEVRGGVTESAPMQAALDGTPAVIGLSVRRAVETFAQRGMVPVLKGSGSTVVRQTPVAGTPLPGKPGAVECTLWLGEQPS